MSTYRRYYCNCSGKPVELVPVETGEDEPIEPACRRCGATPSSDPGHTVTYRDVEDWDD